MTKLLKKTLASSLVATSAATMMPNYAFADPAYKEPQGDAHFDGAEFTVYRDGLSATAPLYVQPLTTGSDKGVHPIYSEAEIIKNIPPNTAIGNPIIINQDYNFSTVSWKDLKNIFSFSANNRYKGREDVRWYLQAEDQDRFKYYVRETKAPEGYKLNPEKVEYTVPRFGKGSNSEAGDTDQVYYSWKNSKAMQRIADEIIKGGLSVSKVDNDLQTGQAQGGASLQGAEFTIYNISARPIKYNGRIVKVSEAVTTITTDANGVASTGANELPYGTYKIKETKAPTGYKINDTWVSSVKIRQDNTIVNVDTNGDKLKVDEQVEIGGIILGKVDKDIFEAIKNSANNADTILEYFNSLFTPQGDGSLENATFAIVTKNDNPVVVDGHTYNKGEVVTTVQTKLIDGKYVAGSGKILPYGTYEIYEIDASSGYKVTSKLDFNKEFTVNKDSHIIDLTGMLDSAPEEIIRGGVALQKKDSVTKQDNPQGNASLAGAQYTITNRSRNSVFVNRQWYKPGEVVLTLTTNDNGFAQTASDALPYGTYEIKEAKAPEGYHIDVDWSQTVEIREAMKLVEVEHEEVVKLGNLSVTKYDSQLGQQKK